MSLAFVSTRTSVNVYKKLHWNIVLHSLPPLSTPPPSASSFKLPIYISTYAHLPPFPTQCAAIEELLATSAAEQQAYLALLAAAAPAPVQEEVCCGCCMASRACMRLHRQDT